MQNKIRKTLPALMLAIVALAVVSQLAVSQVDNVLSLNNLIVNPHPVVAGDNISVSFQLFNSYTSSLSDVSLQLSAQNPIINVSPSSSFLTATIGAGSYGAPGIDTFNYKLHIPSTLPAGEYTVDVVATYSTSAGTTGAVVSEPGVSTMPIDIYVYGTPDIQLTANPSSNLQPGSLVTFTISATNTGTDMARNVTLTILNSTSFTPYGSPTIVFGTMAQSGVAQAQETLLVSQTLPVGTQSISGLLSYTADSGQAVSEPVNISVSYVTPQPRIIATILSADPPVLYSGGNQSLEVSIQNIGYGAAANLSATFLSSKLISSKGSASNFYIGTLQPGASAVESVFISANSNVTSTSHTLPVLFMYQSANHVTNYSYTYQVPVNLQNASIFNITAVTANLAAGGSYLPAVYTIKNIGDEPAQQLLLSLQTVYPLSPVAPTAFVSELQPGQSINVTFYVNIDSLGSTGNYPVTIYEQWKQPNGYSTEQFSSFNDYYAPVSAGGLAGLSITDIALIVVVIVVAAVVAYRFKVVPKIKARIAQKRGKR